MTLAEQLWCQRLQKMTKKTASKAGILIIGEWQAVKEKCLQVAFDFLGKKEHDMITLLRGDEVSELQVMEALNTKGLFNTKKVIIYQDPSFLDYGREKDPSKKFLKAIKANRIKRAATILGRILYKKGIEIDALERFTPQKILSFLKIDSIGDEQIEAILKEHIRDVEKGFSLHDSGGKGVISWLEKKADKKQATTNTLLIIHLSDMPGKSSTLNRLMELCQVIDLRIATDRRKGADKALYQFIYDLLKEHQKQMDKAALELFLNLVGTDSMSAIRNELLKLVNLPSDKKRITIQDVQGLVVRHKEEEIFKLTEAFRAKKLIPALNSLHFLMEQNIPPLVLLAAIRNCTLRIFSIKAAARSVGINTPCPFNKFKYDYWDEIKKVLSDYGAKTMTQMHPYSAFLHFSAPYKMDTLYDIIEKFADLDLALKGSKLDGRILIERFFFKYLT